MADRFAQLLRWSVVLVVSAALFVVGGWLATLLAVSGGTDRVPDVVGMDLERARATLERLEMELQVDPDRLAVEQIPPDHVARQDPAAGTSVKRVRTVRLMLSTGPNVLTWPNLVGDARSRALIALQQQGFPSPYVASAPSSEVPRDHIIAQEPSVAEVGDADTVPLRLLASLGPPTRYYVMVDLVSWPVASVRGYLEALGFRVTERPNRQVVANVAPGTIVQQLPQPGFKIAHGGQIMLQVSR